MAGRAYFDEPGPVLEADEPVVVPREELVEPVVLWLYLDPAEELDPLDPPAGVRAYFDRAGTIAVLAWAAARAFSK